jgi:cell wall-associated NlpC family hydrolase
MKINRIACTFATMRFGYILLLLLWFCCSCGSSKHTHTSGTVSKKEIRKILNRAEDQLGVPYKWGGKTPSGFDCSGFTGYCYGPYLKLPATAALQSETGHKVRSRKAKKGDLIFFKGNNEKSKKVGHVGIVCSGRGKNIRFIHAATNGIQYSNLREDYFRKRLIRLRRMR